MFETVTVDEALKRGQRMISYPITVFMLGSIGLSIYLVMHLHFSPNILPAGFAIGIVAPRIYWSFMITKWRLWAFENVRNVHELKRRAIRIRLFYPDGSIFERLEIRTLKDKERLKLIEKKFDLPDNP